LQENAIVEMMGHLILIQYISPSQLEEVNEDLKGNFEGIGVEFNIFLIQFILLHVIAEGPSDKAGAGWR
jgi:carboxyl-terminal processing protease